jgi:hypothetical protein
LLKIQTVKKEIEMYNRNWIKVIGETMKKRSLATGIAVLLLFALASSAFAASPAARVATPFIGTMRGLETNVFDFPNQRFFVTGNGSGTATHLGKYTLSYGIQVSLETGAGTNGTEHFIAANGDSIYAEGYGQGGPSGTPGVNAITEWYTITGGTGRFAGASGSYIVHRIVVLATGVTWGTFGGKIVIPRRAG